MGSSCSFGQYRAAGTEAGVGGGAVYLIAAFISGQVDAGKMSLWAFVRAPDSIRQRITDEKLGELRSEIRCGGDQGTQKCDRARTAGNRAPMPKA